MARSRSAITLFIILCASATAVVLAQKPAFDVASVRTNTSTSTPMSNRWTTARVDIDRPLRAVLLSAFRLQDYQLVAPAWLSEVRVEIHATIPPGATVQQVPEMLQTLLGERFGLVTHSAARTMDAYHLLVGQGGIKMREVEVLNEIDKEFTPQFTSTGKPLTDTVTETPEGTVRTMATSRGSRRITSRTMYERTLNVDGTATIDAIRMTMAELVPILTLTLDAPVIDSTALTKIYQFQIQLPRDAIIDRLARSAGLGGDSAPSGISTVKAVESLGLKLERRPTPVNVIVVDTISRTPSEN
jgi:uncharacterized protein (TIGR03435 family)